MTVIQKAKEKTQVRFLQKTLRAVPAKTQCERWQADTFLDQSYWTERKTELSIFRLWTCIHLSTWAYAVSNFWNFQTSVPAQLSLIKLMMRTLGAPRLPSNQTRGHLPTAAVTVSAAVPAASRCSTHQCWSPSLGWPEQLIRSDSAGRMVNHSLKI